ncbi:MAG: 50S ribosomal protein L29, partial [Clostridia bacterium]|nr:50S ribosomal protein L29 [Clostridia bacterium]
MKISEIRAMSAEELNAKLKELKEELFNLRFQLAINQLENTNRISEV